jgi:hypothetical protein
VIFSNEKSGWFCAVVKSPKTQLTTLNLQLSQTHSSGAGLAKKWKLICWQRELANL